MHTPTASMSNYTHQAPKYDSDDLSSMVSEPGSPQDISMSTDDEDMLDHGATDFSPDHSNSLPRPPTSNPWRARMTRNGDHRAPTPIQPPVRPGIHPLQQPRMDNPRQHIRQRHPQENISSPYSSSAGFTNVDHLEVPSPIDEDEVPTPPSAAEAAGSQLSMLSVNDMDVEADGVPSISISPSEVIPLPSHGEVMGDLDSAITDDESSPMPDGNDGREPRLFVRKQRQRSGALSAGGGSPVRPPHPALAMDPPAMKEPMPRRGLSMGYRADCERCRMKVPGHFNHFIDS